jgi:hypothetical protein
MEPKDIKFKYNRNPQFEKMGFIGIKQKLKKHELHVDAPLHSRDNVLVHIIKMPSTAQTTASLKRSSKQNRYFERFFSFIRVGGKGRVGKERT